MSVIKTQPTSQNFLSPLGFQFVLKKAPSVVYYVQKVNIPSLSLLTANIPTPFTVIPQTGTRLDFGDLKVEFKVAEDMSNYIEIYQWLRDISFPDSYEQYSSIANQPSQSGDGIYTDITLTILNSTMVPQTRIVFSDCYPVDLSDVLMDSTSVDVDYVTATVTFKYRKYDILPAT